MKKSILVFGRDQASAASLAALLIAHGFDVAIVDSLEATRREPGGSDMIVVALDPACDDAWNGLLGLRRAASESGIPLILVADDATEADEIAAFAVGADDFVRRSAGDERLLARIRAALRTRAPLRTSATEDVPIPAGGPVVFGAVEIDVEGECVRIGGVAVSFTPQEFRILALLAVSRGGVVSRREIFERVWGSEAIISGRTIDVYMTKIRAKLGAEGSRIETLKRVGYRLRA